MARAWQGAATFMRTSPALGGATITSSSRRSLTPKATIALHLMGSMVLLERCVRLSFSIVRLKLLVACS